MWFLRFFVRSKHVAQHHPHGCRRRDLKPARFNMIWRPRMMQRPPSGAGLSGELGDVGIFGFGLGHFRVFSLTQWNIWIYHDLSWYIWMIIIFPLNLLFGCIWRIYTIFRHTHMVFPSHGARPRAHNWQPKQSNNGICSKPRAHFWCPKYHSLTVWSRRSFWTLGVEDNLIQSGTWLVVWNMAFIFRYIGNVIIPTDFHSIIIRGR